MKKSFKLLFVMVLIKSGIFFFQLLSQCKNVVRLLYCCTKLEGERVKKLLHVVQLVLLW